MKGMQKIKRGSGFRGVAAYMLNDKNAQLLGGNMSGRTAEELGREFNVSRQLRPDIKRPVWHNSLRLPSGERLAPEQWCQVADEYMRRMGFSEAHQRVYVMHDDPQGQHVHIAASRVALDGQVYLGRNENLLSTRHIQALEHDFGLTVTPGPTLENGRIRAPDIRRPTAGEVGRYERTGESPARYQLAGLIDQALQDRPTAVQFVERLQLAGVEVRPNINKAGLSGFSFSINGVAFKGSQLGDKYKAKALISRGLNYEQDRDYEWLKRLAASIGNCQSSRGNAADNAGPGDDTIRGTSAPGASDSCERVGEAVLHGNTTNTNRRDSDAGEVDRSHWRGESINRSHSETSGGTEAERNAIQLAETSRRPGGQNKGPGNASNHQHMHSSRKRAGAPNTALEASLKCQEAATTRAADRMLSLMATAIRKALRGGAPGELTYGLIQFSRQFLEQAKTPRREPVQERQPQVDQQPAPEALQGPQEAPRQVLEGLALDHALQGLEQAPSRIEQHRQALAERERAEIKAAQRKQREREAGVLEGPELSLR
ncbi:relaxase/mobilization nuclease domain-containing protein [Pseudomonas aeruginosa]|nr:relaxase/mobilization nuclease domain-containing protein [Pseudomonas aeruginosa]QZV52273.1 relaxase/mobilization nuclease domain-containing protein [Pseudomonas aeruginosa]HCF3656519.1 relaxase/mobilization nuclease domain-containing protein [Pseudomonas aeruginosa]